MDGYAGSYGYGVYYDGDNENTKKRIAERLLNMYLYRDDEMTTAKLEKEITMENLPQRRCVTTDGCEYYFNHDGAVLFAGDSLRGEALPVTRYMVVDNIDYSKTTTYYTCSPETVMSRKVTGWSDGPATIQSLAEVYMKYHQKYQKSGWLGCSKYFNDSVMDMSKSGIINIIVMDNVPYGCFVTDQGYEYYFSREYEVMFGWNPREQVLLPAHHQMYIPNIRVDYIYKSTMTSDRTLRRSVALMDDIRRRAILMMGRYPKIITRTE